MSLAEFDETDYTHSAVKLDRPSTYLLKKARRKGDAGLQDLRDSFESRTIYVGNLSFYTTEEQLYEIFSKVGQIKQIIMGLDRYHFTPCGFCFIIYRNKQDSINAVKYLNGTKLDDRELQIDLDPGFREGRQFGRGVYGGQVSDERRFEYDGGRGGYGKYYQQQQLQDFEGGNGEFDGIAPQAIDFNNARFGARRIQDTDTYIPGGSNEQEQDGDYKIDDATNDENVPIVQQ